MILIGKKFEVTGLPVDRWTYANMNRYLHAHFEKLLKMDKAMEPAFWHMWEESNFMLTRSEIECFMVCMVILKICIAQNYSWPELRNEVKRMVFEGILQKYQTLLPADEYQLLASDVKALQLDS